MQPFSFGESDQILPYGDKMKLIAAIMAFTRQESNDTKDTISVKQLREAIQPNFRQIDLKRHKFWLKRNLEAVLNEFHGSNGKEEAVAEKEEEEEDVMDLTQPPVSAMSGVRSKPQVIRG